MAESLPKNKTCCLLAAKTAAGKIKKRAVQTCTARFFILGGIFGMFALAYSCHAHHHQYQYNLATFVQRQ